MKEIAIKIENLSKQYRLGNIGTGTLSHDLKRWWANVQGKEDPTREIGLENRLAEKGGDYIYALHDINLEVKKGDVVGVMGKNGAGKSTLLKILSRVTTPTTGVIDMYGRVASLLEVGTGFHPELTGRENIFLNGAIMGMTKQEIKKRFDEIVEFGGIGKFIDTPVKRYSSGMYVRLAFAVAAHLDPEILIIDEVLAVGDSEFQKKAIGKMQDVSSNQGRTVLFVSHNIGAIQQLCNKGILLKNGKLIAESSNVSKLIKDYLSNSITESQSNIEWKNSANNYENEYLVPLEFYFTDSSNNRTLGMLTEEEDLYVNILLDIKKLDVAFTLGYCVYDSEERLIYWSYHSDQTIGELRLGSNRLISAIPKNILNEGIYRLEICGGIHNKTWFFEPGHNNPFIVLTIDGNSSKSSYWNYKRPTLIAPLISWKILN